MISTRPGFAPTSRVSPDPKSKTREVDKMSDEKIVVQVDPDLEDLIPGFLSNRATDLETLREALAAENYQSIQSIGHSLKGVGGGYGFTGMSEIGAAIEAAAKQQGLEELKGLVERYGSYLDAVEVKFE